MPKIVWVFIAAVFASERFGAWQTLLALIAVEGAAAYARGWYEAWRDDRA